jgi:hypothetical protein
MTGIRNRRAPATRPRHRTAGVFRALVLGALFAARAGAQGVFAVVAPLAGLALVAVLALVEGMSTATGKA